MYTNIKEATSASLYPRHHIQALSLSYSIQLYMYNGSHSSSHTMSPFGAFFGPILTSDGKMCVSIPLVQVACSVIQTILQNTGCLLVFFVSVQYLNEGMFTISLYDLERCQIARKAEIWKAGIVPQVFPSLLHGETKGLCNIFRSVHPCSWSSSPAW